RSRVGQVRAAFLRTRQLPGGEATLRVRAAPQSLCALAATDRATAALGASTLLDEQRAFAALAPFHIEPHHLPKQADDVDYCARSFAKNLLRDEPTTTGVAVRNAAIAAPLSDLKPRGGDGGRQRLRKPAFWTPAATGGARGGDAEPTNATSLDVRRRVPDSVTQWEARVACVAPRLGLGVSPPAHITAFQAFFLDLALPYAVKRGEVLVLKASLFNYLPHSLPVRVSLAPTPGLELLSNSSEGLGCVEANSSLVLSFRVRALDVGLLNVTVVAEVEPLLPERCGPDFVLAQRDALVKALLVVAEGFPVQRAHSAYICPANFSGDSSVAWRLLLPADVVEDSARADVSVVGDLLGPTLQNLGHLVRLPMGCGEQNMILFVPNLHVIGYLNATGRLTIGMHTEALKNLQKGYQRQLNYRHADGSYSAFGEQDGEGSLWLTAFVVRAFAHARRHIFVDERDLAASVQWVLRQQLENGCFPPVGQVFHKDIRVRQ
ncbi:Murinoglobulin-1, partial [Gryllus bimaculatus]